MRERISRLANGFIENEAPVLKAEPDRIEEDLFTGQWQGSFRIIAENHVQMKGLVYADDPHVTVLRTQFKGYETNIGYSVQLHSEEQEEEITGHFHVVANGSEIRVPFCFRLSGLKGLRSEARFETLEAFAEFVREDSEAGSRLFQSSRFGKQPFMQSMTLQTLYEGLTRRGHKGNALEEFLVCAGVKDQVRLSVVDSARKYQMPEQAFSDCIRVEKNTWGSVLVQIRTDAPFISLERSSITEKDFIENQCQIPYKIDTEKLHSGLNFGRVMLETPYQTFAVDISACLASHRREHMRAAAEYQRQLVRFTKKHLAYYAKTEEEGLLLNQLQVEISRIRSTFPTDAFLQVLHAHLYALQKKPELAGLLLDDAYNGVTGCRMEKPDLYCYYLYVRDLLEEKPGQRDTLAKIVEKYAEEGADSILLCLLRLELNLRFAEDGYYYNDTLRSQFEKGCHSPYLYLAMCLRWQEEPELLQSIGDFELQALYFGARYGLIREELAGRIAAFAPAEKVYRPVYVALLQRLYEDFGNGQLLSAVCTLLMKGNVRTAKSFFWYEKGVLADLRLTRLYEFYLCTRPELAVDPLPEELVRYYSFHHTLGYDAKVVLYRYILSRYMPGEELYDAYREQIRQFVMEQVLRGVVNEQLAYLYERILYPEMIDEKVARVLPAILYTARISCPARQMTHVVLRYEESREETVVSVRDGVAYVPVYADSYCLLLQDGYGNRYAGVACEVTPLMRKEPLLSACQAFGPVSRFVELADCRALLESGVYERPAIDSFREAAMLQELSPLFRGRLVSAVIHWFHHTGEEEVFGRDLLTMDTKSMTIMDRNAWIETLIDKEYDREAWELLLQYGGEGVSSARLCALCSRRITEKVQEREEDLLWLAGSLFEQDRFDKVILEYLCSHENSSTDRMYRIWQVASEAGADTADMEERLLAQMLFTGQYGNLDRVFQAYVGKKTADAMLVKAYFTVRCYQYFMEDGELDEESFAYIEKLCMDEGSVERLALIHRLAVTKYYYGAFILTEEQLSFGRKLFYSIVQEGLVFAYLKPLSRKLGLFHSIQNRQIIEYRGVKGEQLKIRFRIQPDQEAFVEEAMVHMYQGIFVKQLTAFEGDTVEYEICRRAEEDWEPAVQDSLLVYHEDQAPSGRFGYLNRLLFLEQGGDEKALQRAMEDYGVKEAMAEKWFGLLE